MCLQIWSNPRLIGAAISYQVLLAAVKGGLAAGFDVYWIHDKATGGWYNMVHLCVSISLIRELRLGIFSYEKVKQIQKCRYTNGTTLRQCSLDYPL